MALAGALLLVSGLTGKGAMAQLGPQPSPAHPGPARTAPASTAIASDAPDVGATPIVTYVNGQLTIFAENATLSQVLNLLRNTMGTEVDLPAGSASERVWAHLGPGSAHKVLSDLFANTDLDYILQSSSSDPNAIRMLTLSVRSQDTGKSAPAGIESASEGRRPPRYVTPVVASPAPEPEPAPAPQETSAAVAPASAAPGSVAPADSSAAAASSTGTSGSPASEPSMSSPAPVQVSMEPTGPSNVYPQTPQPTAGGFNPHPNAPPNMSSDQMVQQLTNMYQQRRQMQTGQASSTPN